MKKYILALSALLGFGSTLMAQTAPAVTPVLDSGDTTWMIVATALVLFMSIPGLALFYGGLVRRKNVLSVFMQVFIIVAIISIEWVAFGYSNAFGSSSIEWLKPYFGGFDWAFLNGINVSDLSPYFLSLLSEFLYHFHFLFFHPVFL